MSNMNDRERAFENKFAHDEELKFKATARRNKLLGLWAAEKLGKSGDEAEAYAKTVVMADFEEVGDEDVFRKVRADFDAARKLEHGARDALLAEVVLCNPREFARHANGRKQVVELALDFRFAGYHHAAFAETEVQRLKQIGAYLH